jgi:mycothiol synthase
VRDARLDDLGAALAVVVARDVADTGEPDFTLEDLREEWSARWFDPGADALVVEGGEGLLAVAWLRDREAVVAVHPDAEGRGLGAALLAWAERRARERGRALHRQHAANDRARRLLEAAGYAYVRTYWRMQLDLDDPPPEPAWPAGVEPRTPDPAADARALHAVSEESFGAVPDFEPESLSEFRAEHLGRHDFAPGLSVVAEEAGRVVGFALCLAWTEEGRGHVALLAVRPGAAGRGLGTALLRAAFARFRAAGLRQATLGVAADNPRALALYERAGMRRGPYADRYERPAG